MKLRKFLILSIAVVSLFMFSIEAWSAIPNISFQETDEGGGWYTYDYTFENKSDDYLYSLWLDFDSSYNISSVVLPTGWDGFWSAGTTTFLETHSTGTGFDIGYEESLDGFSFTIDHQVGGIPFTAYIDDHNGGRTSVSGTTIPVVPEPVSTILFITGGAVMAARKRFGRKREIA